MREESLKNPFPSINFEILLDNLSSDGGFDPTLSLATCRNDFRMNFQINKKQFLNITMISITTSVALPVNSDLLKSTANGLVCNNE
uniref:Uncharacterized protein n=1 Tax=Parascaris univalens TaxID=6257 RepID=A0A915ABZ3_PARUN